MVIVASGTLRCARTWRRPLQHSTLCSAAAALQVVTVFLAFAMSPTRQTRFLLPVLPYVALLVAWSVEQLRHRLIAGLATVVLATQLALLHGQALHLVPALTPSVVPFERSADSTRILDAVVKRTCRENGPPYLNILAVDPSVRGDWLGPEPANYAVAKKRFWSKATYPPCYYDYVGDAFFGSTVPRAWNSLLARRARYFITVDPSVYPPPPRAFNQVLSAQNFPVMLDTVRTSGLFVLEPPLREDPGILIFHRP
jgi:hypothetical protein